LAPAPQQGVRTKEARTIMKTTHPPTSAGAARIAACATMLLLPASAALAQDANLARNLAATCANCHGTNGQARGDMKVLAGMSADKIVAHVNDFRSGAQPSTVMGQISKGYTDEQIKLVAGYFAAQPARK
jgi:cytochrome subunit of sulfide dehydrogenase